MLVPAASPNWQHLSVVLALPLWLSLPPSHLGNIQVNLTLLSVCRRLKAGFTTFCIVIAVLTLMHCHFLLCIASGTGVTLSIHSLSLSIAADGIP